MDGQANHLSLFITNPFFAAIQNEGTIQPAHFSL